MADDGGEVLGTILVVEDDPLWRVMIEYALGEAGYNVLAADSAKVARELLLVTSISGLVTGTHLGRASGWELARDVREAYPDAAIVIVSDDGRAPWANLAVARSIHVKTPFSVAAIIVALSELSGDHN